MNNPSSHEDFRQSSNEKPKSQTGSSPIIDKIKSIFNISPRDALQTMSKGELEVKPEELGKPYAFEISEEELQKPEIEINPNELGTNSSKKEELSMEIEGDVPNPSEQIKIANRKVEEDIAKIKQLFPRGINTPIQLNTHHVQEARGQDNKWGCVPSSVLNAINALGYRLPGITEESITRKMGGFRQNGLIGEQQALDYLISEGLQAYSNPSLLGMARNLESGGVSLLVVRAHARLVNGMEVTPSGQIIFRVNDPWNTTGRVEKIMLDDMAKLYMKENPLNRGIINIRKQLSPQDKNQY